MDVTVTPWPRPETPEMHEVLDAMRAEDLAPYRWDNEAGYVYAPHQHPYHKVLYCLRGSIRFVLTPRGRAVDLRPGDRMDLPPGTEHGAFVGPDGVACLEAQR